MSCMEKYIKSANFADTGFSYTMSLISGKHKMVILYCLMEYEPVRFNEMKRYLGTISDKTLSSNLKELEAEGVEILTCGTCLNFYGLTEKLAVGGVTNMYVIAEKMLNAGNVVKP